MISRCDFIHNKFELKSNSLAKQSSEGSSVILTDRVHLKDRSAGLHLKENSTALSLKENSTGISLKENSNGISLKLVFFLLFYCFQVSDQI